MKNVAMPNDEAIIKYLERTFHPEDRKLAAIRQSATDAEIPAIHVGPFDGLLLEVLTAALQPKRLVEIGTLVGYSATRIARALLPDAKLWSLELSERHAAIARKNIKDNQLENKIEILVGPAVVNLKKVEQYGPFDLVFIDADKQSYPLYFSWAQKNLRVGGCLLADNTLAWGHIHKDQVDDPELQQQILALREFNNLAANTEGMIATLLPTGEGLTMAVKVK